MSVAVLRDALEGAQRELGASSRAGFFDVALQALRKIDGHGAGTSEVHLSPGAAHLAGGLPGVLGAQVRIVTTAASSTLSDEVILPAAAAAVLTLAECTALPDAVRQVTQGQSAPARALFVLCEAAEADAAEKPVRDLARSTRLTVKATSPADAADAIREWLDEVLPEAQRAATEASLGRIGSYARQIVADELKSLELRKQLLSDDAAARRRIGGGPGAGSDLNGRIRNILQRNLQDAERAFKTKYDELNRVKKGEFQALAERLSGALDADNMRLIELASKTETTETEIDEQFTETFVARLRKQMQDKMADDVSFIKEASDLSINQINGLLAAEGYAPINPKALHAPPLNPGLVLESHFHIQRKFNGEVTKDGPMQYFIALRDYTGMIMVLVGILAPLTLVATSPDAPEGSLLAFINEIAPVVKRFRSYLTFLTAILVAVMLIYGFIDLRRRIPAKRIEERERDLRKARESLDNEGRRMFNDSARDWVGQISAHVRELIPAINAEIEHSVRARSQNQAEAMEEQRRRLAVEQASVETRLKGVTLLERKFDMLAKR
ncbi:hypothetical protein [Novosphingobium sp.]|uniref:hypothetical protein n=1 Tax=Novosphingobium sp. TaxID=1874826 RepID=UPI0035B4BDC6